VTGDIDLIHVPDPFAQEIAQGLGRPLPPPPARPASPSRSHRRATAAAAVCGAVLYEGAGLAFFKMRPDIRTTSTGLVALELLLPLAIAAAAMLVGTRRGQLGLGEPVARLAAWVLGTPLAFVLITLAAFPHDDDGAFWSRTKTCFLVTALLGAGPLMLAGLAFRNAFAAAAGWRTAAAGIASGALAAGTIALVCPDGGALHVLLGHGAMMVVMGLVGAGVLRTATRI
jgi:hypothetical protein